MLFVASIRREVLADLEEETVCNVHGGDGTRLLGLFFFSLSSNLNLVLRLPVAIGYDGKHVSKFTFKVWLEQGWRRMCIRWCVHNFCVRLFASMHRWSNEEMVDGNYIDANLLEDVYAE